MHHPYSGSWGYQVTGFYAPVSTMGSPDDFRYFVDHMHANGIGVLLDWVPAHFATDPWALARFDGTALYEHDDPRRGEHPDWGTYVFNLGRSEVQNFLLANALFWLREYHADGIRVDAVASMLYLDYSRKEGEWVPNAFGGREDLDAVAFLKELNELVHAREPGVISAAEESTAWPGVSRPTYVGGLGFGFKWNMGWMHDTLSYFQRDPIYRRHPPPRADVLARLRVERELHPAALARRGRARQGLDAREDAGRPLAAARESARALRVHVVASRQEAALHGRRAGDAVGVGAQDELPWWLLEHTEHAGMRDLMRDLNTIYREEPALWEVDFSHEGFVWIEPNDAMGNIVAFMRVSGDKRAGRLHREPRAGAARELPRRAAEGGAWRAPEHGLGLLRRHGRRQPRRGAGRASRLARPAVLGRGDAAAARRRVAAPSPAAAETDAPTTGTLRRSARGRTPVPVPGTVTGA